MAAGFALSSELKAYARSIGFDLLGITSAEPPDDFQRYRSWIDRGHAAGLGYLCEEERTRKRKEPSLLLPGARSILVGAVSYKPERADFPSDAKIARYAWGRDYHAVLKSLLEKLTVWLALNVPGPFSHRSYVDTGPLLERSLAARAGIGWIGKNTCLIHRSFGSFVVLGELITTLDLPHDSPGPSLCGSCTRCLDACPTKALIAPFELDARKCISYQTLENRAGELPGEIASKLDGWVAGCDICQEACPWNRKAPPGRLKEFHPLPHTSLSREEILDLDPTRHRSLFKNTALERIPLEKLKRNTSGGSQGKPSPHGCLPRES